MPGSPLRSATPSPHTTDLLRFAAVGSVDDGKSTLIGRLLLDTRQLFDDQVEAVADASARRGLDALDLSFVTDGLRAEREQGITIDVAYRYAATPARKFVIADCPGHVQYTRNMATGASTADLALVVVDVTRGLRDQTRRHALIAALLGVEHFVVAANKMDLVDWNEAVYQRLVAEVLSWSSRLGLRSCEVVPVSALHGDNVVARTTATSWYAGPTLLEALETAPTNGRAESGARLPVQWVLRRPGGGRRYAGMLNGGSLRRGDAIVVQPHGHRSTIAAIETLGGPAFEAHAGLSVAVELADDLDVSRGDLLAPANTPAVSTRELRATVCWFAEHALRAGERLRVKHTTRATQARVATVVCRLEVDNLRLVPTEELANNEIGVIELHTAISLAVDSYRRNRTTGSFVMVDETTHATLAAGMVGLPFLDT